MRARGVERSRHILCGCPSDSWGRILDAVGIFMGLIKEREDQWNGFPSNPDTRE